jgi:acetyl-CoA acetyltransferase
MRPAGQSAILGIGQTPFTKNSGKTVLALAAEASLAAIGDAGIEPGDIDGAISFTWDDNDEMELARALGIPELRWTARSPFGGGGAYVPFQLAAAAIESGAASTILIYRSFNERSESRFGQPNTIAKSADLDERHLYRAFGLTTPAQIYALWYRVYMDKYGVTSEDLGRYVVQARAYAATNPDAWFYGRPLTLEEHQESRWIVDDVLRKLDCCQETDGGAAFIVTSLARARAAGRRVVRILAADQVWRHGGHVMYNYYNPDLSAQEDSEILAARLWETTGLSPREMDMMTIYENFSPIVHMSLEGYGFCKAGEARDLINSGGIGPGGLIPVNTNGGLLGEAYLHGLNNVVEAVRQMRGTAANQIPDAATALVTGRHCALVLARE